MKLYGMISTFNEGRLLRECVRSLLEATELVFLYEGPFEDSGIAQENITDSLRHPDIRRAVKEKRLIVVVGKWETQAQKLTIMTKHAQRAANGVPVWGMHLDGDEVLIWPNMLRDIVERFTEAMPNERFMNIKLVELDGTVGGTQTHLIRMDLVERYFVSGSQILFKGDSFPVSLYNPDGDRFPIQGEPHILHRSALRSSGRDAPALRAHLSQEAQWFEIASAAHGLAGVKPGD